MKKIVLFIHGFSAKTTDNEYFIKEMQKKPDVEIHTFTLPGHNDKGVTKTKYQEWLDKSEEELLKLTEQYNKIILIGHSMGGAIATILAARHSQVKKLILIAPAYEVGSFSQNKEDLLNLLTNKIDKNLGTGFEGVLEKVFTVSKTSYFEVRKIGHIAFDEIENVKSKVLILHGTKDSVVPYESSKKAVEEFNVPVTFTAVENCRHDMFISNKKEEVSEYIYKYIKGGISEIISKRKKI